VRTSTKFAALAFATSIFAACSPPTASMSAQPVIAQPTPPTFETLVEQKAGWITEDGGQSQLDFNPQVDILFVTDNSESMKSAQANLVRNIDKFADGINRNKMIDYHIGVVSTWDSTPDFAKNKKDQYDIGDLRFIKDSKNQSYNKRYVTRDEKNLLASTLDIGVAPLAQGGPQHEEFFSPLIAAMDKAGNGKSNDGFFRPEAQLVVIFMTDADDSNSNISVEEMDRKLVDFKGGRRDKLSVYGVLVKAGDADQYKDWALRVHPEYHPECFDKKKNTSVRNNNSKCKVGFGPERIEQLIVNANQGSNLTATEIKDKYIMSIISRNFGTDLTNIGADIKVRTLAKEITLTRGMPVVENGVIQVRVRYGTPDELAAGQGQVIPQGKNGWLYSPAKNSIRLSGEVNYQYKEGARFAVDLKPALLN